MAEFKMNMAPLKKAIRKMPEAAGRGATSAMADIKDDWVRVSRDIAPLDASHLRKQIRGKIINPGITGMIEVHANAGQHMKGKRFNYAYYIHEQDAGGKQLRTPGTEKKFLDKAGEKREAEWQRWLEDRIKSEIEKARR